MQSNYYTEYLKSEKWQSIARRRLEIDGFTCQMCGSTGTVKNRLEVHHLSYKYLGHEEGRIYMDLVTLCHICHKNIHRLMGRITGPDGRRGWNDNPNVPRVHVYTLNGEDLEMIERG